MGREERDEDKRGREREGMDDERERKREEDLKGGIRQEWDLRTGE